MNDCTLSPDAGHVGATVDDLPQPGFPLQLLVVARDYVATFPLTGGPEISLGRGSENALNILEQSVSRRHAMLVLTPFLRLTDLGSAYGTQVRGKRLTPHQTVHILPNEPFMLGGATAVVQRRSQFQPQTLWTSHYFTLRLANECERAARFDEPFVLLRAHLPTAVSAEATQRVLGNVMRPGDVVGFHLPGQYLMLLVGATRRDGDRVAHQLRLSFKSEEIDCQLGMACFPASGKNVEALIDATYVTVPAVAGNAEASPDEEPSIVVRDRRMRQLRATIKQIGSSEISVLLLGETGVGKEVIAGAIHRASPRRAQTLIRINCAALSPTLLESELFGHERGAFTGATQQKPGLLEAANGGTVFLDEIGDLSLEVQVKLLRVLEEGKVRRVGGVKSIAIDVRFIAATNRDLEDDVRSGGFRKDLYYRLNGVSIVIPPLRERVEEIEPLARLFLAKRARRNGNGCSHQISDAALSVLRGYSWPGNIRELRNVIERAQLFCTNGMIGLEHLPVDKMQGVEAEPPTSEAHSSYTHDGTRGLHRQRLVEVLDQCGGNQTRAALRLGISRKTLLRRLDEYGLPRPRKKVR